MRAGTAGAWANKDRFAACVFDCAAARGAKQQEARTAAKCKREVRRNKDWSLIACPPRRFELERSKAVPDGDRPRSQGIRPRGALRCLWSERETARHAALEAYHTSLEDSLVLGNSDCSKWRAAVD